MQVNFSDSSPSGTEDEANDSNMFVGHPVSEGVRVTVMTLGWLSCVTGFFGNVLIIVTILHQTALRSIHNIYIANLAVADILFIAFAELVWLLDLGIGYAPVVNRLHCEVTAFIMSICFTVSVYTLVLIAINRYLCVCHNKVFVKVFNKPRTLASCAILWFLGIIFSVFPFFHLGGTTFTYSGRIRLCLQNFADFSSVSSIKTTMDLILPSVLIGGISLAIIRFWKKNKNAVRQWQRHRNPVRGGSRLAISTSDVAIIRSLVSVFVVLVVFYVPMAVAGIASRVVYVPTDLFQFLILFLFLNHSINWIIYGFMNKHFREGYQRLLMRCCHNEVAPASPAADPTGVTVFP